VIASYFADKTLVSQQIDSFNEFVNNTMQELVDEGQSLILDQNMQHTGKAGDVTVSFAERGVVQSEGSGARELTVARALS
jgi:DNA-directed RNA polymerase beta subunit